MRLVLRNFRQHAYLELDLPESGLVLFKGRSGAGKSTVLDAIYEAKYGEADDVTPWGTSVSTEVEYWTNRPVPMYIKRTRGPKTLLVRIGDTEYADEAAQAVINATFCGMDEHVFLASSYARQGMPDSLLTLGAADQLRFVQKLSPKDPEEMRQRIQESVTRRATALETDLKVALAAQEALMDAEKRRDEAVFVEPEPPMDPAEMDRLYDESEATKKLLEEHSQEYFKATKALQNPIYMAIKNLDAIRAQTDKAIADNDFDIKSLEKGIKDLGGKCDSKVLEECRKALKSKKTRLEILDQIKALGTEVTKKLKSPDGMKASEAMKLRERELVERSTEIRAEDETILVTLEDLRAQVVVQKCPECSAPLVIDGGKIVRPSGAIADAERGAKMLALHDRRGILGNEDESIAKDLKWLNYVQAKVDQLKAGIPPDLVPEINTIAEIDSDVEKINAQLTAAIQYDTKRAGYEATLSKLKAKNNELRASLAKSEAQIATAVAGGLEPETDVKAMVNALEIETNDLKHKLISYNPVRDMRTRHIAAMITRDKQAAVYAERVKVVQQREAERDKKLTESNDANIRLAAAKRLRERSDEAATMAIELILSEINDNAKAMIDKMFPEDGTTIRIKNVSTTGKGDQRAKFSTEIYHKGKTVKKINSFSGGERSRAHVAFKLALAEMYKSPILLIDEGFTGLPEEQLKECLEALKDVSGNRLIVVIEHGAPESFFDQVITFGNNGLEESA